MDSRTKTCAEDPGSATNDRSKISRTWRVVVVLHRGIKLLIDTRKGQERQHGMNRGRDNAYLRWCPLLHGRGPLHLTTSAITQPTEAGLRRRC